MEQFSPCPQPSDDQLWVKHAWEIPVTDQLLSRFTGQLEPQTQYWQEMEEKATRNLDKGGRSLAGSFACLLEGTLSWAEQEPGRHLSNDELLAGQGLCTLALARLGRKLIEPNIAPADAIGILSTRIVPELSVDFEDRGEPFKYTLHADKDLVDPQLTELPSYPSERWYVQDDLYFLCKNPAKPLIAPATFLAGDQIEFDYDNMYTLRPFLARPE